MPKVLRLFVLLVSVAAAIYLIINFYLALASSTWLDAIGLTRAIRPVIFALALWIIVVCTLQAAKQRDAQLWYVLEHPFYGFLCKVILLVIVVLGGAVLIVEGTGVASASALGAWSYRDAASPLVILATGALATIGWNYTAFETRRGENRRYTMETINKVLSDPGHERLHSQLYMGLLDKTPGARTGNFEAYQTMHRDPHYADCVAFFTMGTSPAWLANASADQKAAFVRLKKVYAFGKYCDFVEWFALLTRLRRIDERIARVMLADSLTLACHEMQDFIKEARSQDEEFYEHLTWLYGHWTVKRNPLHP